MIEFYAPWCGHCKALKGDYTKLGEKFGGIVNIGAIDCDSAGNKNVCGRFGIQGFPTLKVLVPEDGYKKAIDYQGARSLAGMSNFVLNYLKPQVTKLTASNEVAFLDHSLDKVILFTDKTKSTHLFSSLSAKFKGRLAFGEVHKNEATLLEKYEISKFPTLLVVSKGEKIMFSGKTTVKDLVQFLSPFAGVQVEEGSENRESRAEESFVIQLTDKNFDDLVLGSKVPWIIEFFAPWCGHCKNLAPHWESAAKSWKGSVKFGAVDCTVNQNLARLFSIQGYPTIKAFRGIDGHSKRGYNNAVDYNGERTAHAISTFAGSLITDIVTVVTYEQLDVFVQARTTGSKVVLFSAKAAVPDLFKSLALELQGMWDFGVVLRANAEMVKAATQGATSNLPAIFVFVQKDGAIQSLLYNGPISRDAILQFLNSFTQQETQSNSERIIPDSVDAGLIHLNSPQVFNDQCVSKLGLCLIAFPVVAENSKWGSDSDWEENRFFHDVLSKVAESAKLKRMVRVLWSDRLIQQQAYSHFRLPDDGSVALVVLHAGKKRAVQFIGSFDEESIVEFVDDVLRGKISTFGIDSLPVFIDESESCDEDMCTEDGHAQIK